MKLAEILDKSTEGDYIPLQCLQAKKNQIKAFFNHYFGTEPVVLAWAITNTGGRTTLCAWTEMEDCIEQIIDREYTDLTEEEKDHERELIAFNARLIKDL